MKNLKPLKSISLFTTCVGLLGVVLAPATLAAAPGKGWDVFNAGQGERIQVSAYQGTSLGGVPGKGYDLFRAGVGEPLDLNKPAYVGTSRGGMAGEGWDLYRTGQGEAI